MALKHTFVGIVHMHTAKAILFTDHFWLHARWLPKSQVIIVDYDDETVIKASEWICGKNQIHEFEENIDKPEGLNDEHDAQEDDTKAYKAMLRLRGD